jgi:uncharacterized membrane protein
MTKNCLFKDLNIMIIMCDELYEALSFHQILRFVFSLLWLIYPSTCQFGGKSKLKTQNRPSITNY